MYPNFAHRATQSDNPQFFICLKNGRWRPVDVPAGTFAVMYRGRWCPVFSRTETDAEYFRNHSEMRFRLKLHRSRWHSPDCFNFTITTRDPEVYATGDSGDWRYYHRDRGTPREHMIAECERMLAHPHRCSDSKRWLASQGL